MIKTVKGFLSKTTKGSIVVNTSVFVGENANQDISNNIKKGLENFGFSPAKENKNSDFEGYSLFIDSDEETIEKLDDIIKNRKRSVIKLMKEEEEDGEKPKISIVSASVIIDRDTNEEPIHIKEYEEIISKVSGGVYLIKKQDGSESLSIISSVRKDNEEKIKYLESLGFKMIPPSPEYEDSEWSSYSCWINKFNPEILDLLEPNENNKLSKKGMILLKVNDYGNIREIIEINNIEEFTNHTNEEAENNAVM